MSNFTKRWSTEGWDEPGPTIPTPSARVLKLFGGIIALIIICGGCCICGIVNLL